MHCAFRNSPWHVIGDFLVAVDICKVKQTNCYRSYDFLQCTSSREISRLERYCFPIAFLTHLRPSNYGSSTRKSADKSTRDKAIKNLAVFLSDSSREPINEHDLTKLWKGIWYCMQFLVFLHILFVYDFINNLDKASGCQISPLFNKH